jgi:hypothetical protein
MQRGAAWWRRLWLLVAAGLLTFVILGPGLALGYLRHGVPFRDHAVALPPASAAAATVVRAYLAALDANDKHTAAACWRDTTRPGHGYQTSNVIHRLATVYIEPARPLDPVQAQIEPRSPGTSWVIVHARYRIAYWPPFGQTPTEKVDTSFALVRHEPSGPWRIVVQGFI